MQRCRWCSYSATIAFAAFVFAAFLLAGSGCGGSGAGTDLPTSSPELGIYAGTVLDEDGRPVAGALVSIDGIAAEAVTDGDGTYLIEHPALAAPLPAPAFVGAVAPGKQQIKISVVAPGFDPTAGTTEVGTGERTDVQIFRVAAGPEIILTSPTGEKAFVVPMGCSDPHVAVEGYARFRALAGLRLDVVILIDRSGSTSKMAFDVDGDGLPESVLAAEVAAAREFLAGLDPTISRVAVVSFHDSTTVHRGFTRDLDAASEALSAIRDPVHGTNYEAAFVRAAELFDELAADDEVEEVPSEDPGNEVPPPVRAVLFLSDGIPTSHGIPRNTADTNLTQSREDRLGAIAGAERLGETGATLHAFAVIPAEDDRRRTTLPHSVAACGGGHFENLPEFGLLIDELRAKPLDVRLRVELRNLTTGEHSRHAALYPDGFFSERVSISGAPLSGGVWTNDIEVLLTASLGPERRTAREVVTVRCLSEDAAALLSPEEIAGLQSATTAVSDLPHLTSPSGALLGDEDLRDFLESEFEDAVELHAVDTFQLADPLSGVPLRVDLVFKEACYQSDVGYLFLDTANPPASAAEALAGVADDQILFNSGEGGLSACNVGSVADGLVSREVPLPRGGVVAFFLIPNRTLAQYRANPAGGPDPLFTIPGLNPGRHDQALTFRSLRGRTQAGVSQQVVREGPLLIVAFEDLTISKQSDQDFSDVVFMLSSAAGRLDALDCEK